MKKLAFAPLALALLTGPAMAGMGMNCANNNTQASTMSDVQIIPASREVTLAPAGDLETSKVISVVSSIPMSVDLAAYDLAEKAFAPKITIDYTSLWSGQPSQMTPAELMTAWRGIVPGFDGTWHELSNVKAEVRGDLATASAFVDGRHWIGDKLWRPVGNYYWELAKMDGQWKVTKMTFDMTQEIGDRAVATMAMDKVKALTQ
jgi:SnoaL-like domain